MERRYIPAEDSLRQEIASLLNYGVKLVVMKSAILLATWSYFLLFKAYRELRACFPLPLAAADILLKRIWSSLVSQHIY